MTTTELIELLKRVEFGASGRPRKISFIIESDEEFYIDEPEITKDSTGDGIAGAELTLRIK